MKRGLFVLSAVLTIALSLLSTVLVRADSQLYDNPSLDKTILDGFPSDPKGAIQATRERIAAGDMTGAIQHLAAYVAAHPGEIDPRRFLGDLYFRTGQIDRAALVYQEILKIAPNDKETHNRLGTVYAEENRVDDAIAQFNGALPGTDSVDDLVELHQRRGDLGAYEAQVEQMAHDFPNDSAIQAELGQVFAAIRQPAEAAIYYRRALDNDVDNLTAINGLGLAMLNMHQYDDAISEFRRCLQIEPALYQCHDNLAATYLESGRLDEGKAALDKAYKLEPERAETFVNYGYLADMQNDWQRAVSQYAKAIELYPYLREAYIDLALDYERRHLYVLAQAVLIKGIASVHDDGRLHVLLGDAYEAQGDRTDALAQFQLGEKGSDPDAVSIATQRVGLLDATTVTKPL
jgi:tetratricopeptide (TPR) repeat protein